MLLLNPGSTPPRKGGGGGAKDYVPTHIIMRAQKPNHFRHWFRPSRARLKALEDRGFFKSSFVLSEPYF